MIFNRYGNRYLIRIDRGEELVETLNAFCRENGLYLGSVSGIGAVSYVKIGYFEPKTKEYHAIEKEGDFEITNLTGNITTMDGEIYLHFHATLTDENYRAFGGHLNAAVVSATCEVIIDAVDGACERIFDEEIGLNLLKDCSGKYHVK